MKKSMSHILRIEIPGEAYKNTSKEKHDVEIKGCTRFNALHEHTPSHYVDTFVAEVYTTTFSDISPFHSALWNYFPKTLYSPI